MKNLCAIDIGDYKRNVPFCENTAFGAQSNSNFHTQSLEKSINRGD